MMRGFFILLVAVFLIQITTGRDYYRFRFDPEINQNVTEIVKGKGYPAEYHEVLTPDGYILGVQRIPGGRNFNGTLGKPVLLQHGLLDSAHTWICNLPNESLGFILADAGYDVWLGNSRGNTYSKKHVKYTPKDKEFWEFSWDNMADYDLPSIVNYIRKVTGAQKVAYVGHSQGTEMAFAKLNEDADLQNSLSIFVALGPVVTLGHIESPIKYVAPFANQLETVVDLFGTGEFLPNDSLMKFLARFLCGHTISSPVCSNVIFLICGYDKENMNETRIPVYVSHTPAGTSVQNMVHYSQAILSNEFRRFDFGPEGNMQHYGQTTPPLYGLQNITLPIAIFYGGHDWLADRTDAELIIYQLRHTIVHAKFIPNYNHLDFVWAVNSAEVVYTDILQVLKQFA